MNQAQFHKGAPGRLLRISPGRWAFVPTPLPPALEPTWALAQHTSEADRALGELAGVAQTIPNPHLLIEPFTRREALLSSRIEGTEATLSELFSAQAGAQRGGPRQEVREVLNYVDALEYGLKRMKKLPLSLRLIRELHQRVMWRVRGSPLLPGEFRRSQNFIGPAGCNLEDATYVPPPIPQMHEALDRFEKYLHEQRTLPRLVRLAIIHYQFEAIHPFLDGNGRVGRLLLTLLLCAEGLLPQPLLYLSAYFERNRQEYYRLLLAVSHAGHWQEWIIFFLRGVTEESRDAVARSNQLLELRQQYRKKLQRQKFVGSTLELMETLFMEPVVTVAAASARLSVTPRAAEQNIGKLVEAGILTETTGKKRYRAFAAHKILRIAEADRAPNSE